MTEAPGGVCTVLVTPFHEDGTVDPASMARQVEHHLAWGVDGVVVFGLAGEVYKLTDDERRGLLDVVVRTAAGAVPVIAGAEHSGTEGAIARSVSAVKAGAAGLMLYPPTFVRPDAAGVADYYTSVARAVDVPIVVQDAPAWTGVPLPVDLLLALRAAAPSIAAVKVEAPPTAPKIAALVAAGLPCIGGYGALHLAEECEAGVTGIMPGAALPGLYTRMWACHAAGDRDGLWELFVRALPLLAFQLGSLDLFVAVQKALLAGIGVLDSARLRRPGTPATPAQLAWLRRLLDRTGLGGYLRRAPA